MLWGQGAVCLSGRPSVTGSQFSVALKFRVQGTGGREGWGGLDHRDSPGNALLNGI